MELIHAFLCLLLVSSGFFVSFSRNPIESVLFLILSFCSAAAILFLFNSEFLGLLFIIIYVGAIAVLFLFVVMMLNVKNKEPDSFLTDTMKNSLNKSLITFFAYVGFFVLFFSIRRIFFRPYIHEELADSNFSLVFDSFNNIDVLGQVLYNYYLICFLLAGLILLIALVGSIVLTLRYNSSQKNQLINRQLSRTDNFISFFK
jgi:NADH-quinone oxidoreductase subunit J